MRWVITLLLVTFVSCAPAAKTQVSVQQRRPEADGAQSPVTRPSLPQDEKGLTALHRAAERGDTVVVEQLLNSGVDPNARSRDGATPLSAAMAGAVMDADKRGMAPPGQSENWSVEKARQRERETRGQATRFSEVTRLLLAHGADARMKLRDDFTPLHIAAMTGNAELVALLLAAGADPNATTAPRHTLMQTPLIGAAGRGEIDVVRALLDAGADPAKVPEESRGYSVNQAMSNLDVFRLLLDRGMKLPPDALAMAARNKRVEIAEEIVRRQKPADLDDALYAAVKAGKSDSWKPGEEQRLVRTVTTLLDAGASPSAPNASGEALVYAVRRGPPSVAKLLRDRGAKVDWSRVNEKNHEPTHIAYAAVLEHRLDTLRELEALGMPLDILGAAALGRAERLREVVKQFNGPLGSWGVTAIYFAGGFGHEDCVRVLLDAGVDLNERVPSWDTPDIGPRPLDGAAENGHIAIVRLMLDRGAKPELMTLDEDDRAKLTPEIKNLLKNHGAR